ncbi:MAG TPA: nitroreductase [Bradyrhizobium sp.]|nr:nitroreductase [Bradyrhizobium sp.]
MDISEAIYGRRATRSFKTDQVSETILTGLIDAAIQAPSAVNEQPWLFTVIRDKELMSRISQEAKDHMLRTSPAGLASHHFQSILGDPDFHVFYHAPALIVISATSGPWTTEDCALAAENMMLSAHAAGLGTCWIGFAQAWLATAAGKAAIKVPDHYVPVAPIIIGYPTSAPPRVERKPAQIEWIS